MQASATQTKLVASESASDGVSSPLRNERDAWDAWQEQTERPQQDVHHAVHAASARASPSLWRSGPSPYSSAHDQGPAMLSRALLHLWQRCMKPCHIPTILQFPWMFHGCFNMFHGSQWFRFRYFRSSPAQQGFGLRAFIREGCSRRCAATWGCSGGRLLKHWKVSISSVHIRISLPGGYRTWR